MISGFRRQEVENSALIGHYAASSGNFSPSRGLLWRETVQFGRWKPTFQWVLPPQYFWLQSSSVKREAVHSSEQPISSNELHVLLPQKPHNIHTHVIMPSSGPPWGHVPTICLVLYHTHFTARDSHVQCSTSKIKIWLQSLHKYTLTQWLT